MEVTRSRRPPVYRYLDSRPYPKDELHKPALGCTSYLRVAVETWHRAVAQSTVSKCMIRRRGPPYQSWRMLLRKNADIIATVGLFVVPAIDFKLLYCLGILAQGRGWLIHYAVTAHPIADRIARQIGKAFPCDRARRYLVRDRDAV